MSKMKKQKYLNCEQCHWPSKIIDSESEKYKKLLKFVKYIASGEPKGVYFKIYGFEYVANVLLEEIGESITTDGKEQ